MMRTGRKMPSFFGMDSSIMLPSAMNSQAQVFGRGLLAKPRTWGLEPLKSMVRPSPATVTATRIPTSKV